MACIGAPALAAEAPLWELGAGVAALHLPHYRGSDQARDWLLPIPFVVYRGRILRADREGARAVLLDTGRTEFDVSFAASPPTRSDDNRARGGMPDLKPTAEFGPNLTVHLAAGSAWKLDAQVPVRAAFTLGGTPRHIGWMATPNLDLDLRLGAWHLGVRAALLWGDRRANAYFYEVAPAYATALRPAYRARAGGAGQQLTLALSRRSGRLWLGAFWRADSVAGAAFEGSPLVRRSAGRSFGVGASWVFATSAQQVPVPD